MGLLCVWEWQVHSGAGEAALRAAVSEGLAPGSWVTGEHFQPLLGPTSCLGAKTERPSQEVAFFLQSLFCGPWHVGRSLMAGSPPPHPSPWEATRGHGPLCYDSKPDLPRILSVGVATRQMFSVHFYTPCWAPGPASPPLSAPRAHGIPGVPSSVVSGVL